MCLGVAGACFLVPTGSVESVLDSRRDFLELFPGGWTQPGLPQLLMAGPGEPRAATLNRHPLSTVAVAAQLSVPWACRGAPEPEFRSCLDGAGPPGICPFIQELNGSFIRVSKIHF